jgi:hypothetical protein
MSTQDKQRTNTFSVKWRSCKSVILHDGELHCLLEPEKTYDLAESYGDKPHFHFMRAASDDELRRFIRAWGPLYIPNGQIPADATVRLPVSLCRAYQRQMNSVVRALTAFRLGNGERGALEELIAAMLAVAQGDLDPYFVVRFGVTGDVLEWAKKISIADVRAATNHLLDTVLTPMFHLRLAMRHSRNRRVVEAGWTFMNLEEALRWMIWYDEFNERPIICCAECLEIFRGDSTRARKYCSDTCGHKATARKAMRKKRALERGEEE